MGCSVAIAAADGSNRGANPHGPRPTRTMPARGQRRRVRWGNVLRAAVAVPVLGLVIAWPRIGGGEQALPDDRAVPVAGVAAAAEPAEEAPARDTVGGA